MTKIQRKNLPTLTVLTVVESYRTSAYAALCLFYPPKVVLAAFRRDERKGWLDYGTSEAYPWITGEGSALMEANADEVKWRFKMFFNATYGKLENINKTRR